MVDGIFTLQLEMPKQTDQQCENWLLWLHGLWSIKEKQVVADQSYKDYIVYQEAKMTWPELSSIMAAFCVLAPPLCLDHTKDFILAE